FFDDERTHAIFKIVADVHREGSVCPGLQVKGTNEHELAMEFIAQMKISVRSGDWSKILSSNRHFVCVDEHNDYVSSGPGLEQSTVTKVFRQFFEEHEGEFCTSLYDDYTTLQSANLQISSDKHDELVLFGAATALALIYGHYPGRLNPLFLIYLLNDCNLSCLHRDLVSSYLPSICETLEQAGHRKLSWEMLHNVVVGPVDVDNAYFTAFLKGFLLPCSTGIDLVDIVRSFFGGAEEFVRTAEISTICNFASLNIRIVCDLKTQSLDELTNALSAAGPQFAGKSY
ncbi:hypothetical protein F5879DRAFT_809975, partial [Lentinula edodes]